MQKKYPFIKIDKSEIMKDKDKEIKRKEELKNLNFKPYNI